MTLSDWEREAKESVYAIGYQRDFSRLEDRVIKLIEIIRQYRFALKQINEEAVAVSHDDERLSNAWLQDITFNALKIGSELE